MLTNPTSFSKNSLFQKTPRHVFGPSPSNTVPLQGNPGIVSLKNKATGADLYFFEFWNISGFRIY
ncbi:hypothetical protein DU19_1001 [Chlamydia muridarum]|nr:hypothetical protein DU17_1003 [Chlamydia muridarum]KDU81940.1 hypothetical protein DU18_1001 [Chlamydia muridarum]KDU82499.1 hypothetical protein DU19_1001 [Chlamydia muridarum]KDU83895.1 hypothetical protein DU20_1001 [Chlamydia muridarum]KDU84676.1 hypothetical protein DU21_1003 [Chlamydia muridarum]